MKKAIAMLALVAASCGAQKAQPSSSITPHELEMIAALEVARHVCAADRRAEVWLPRPEGVWVLLPCKTVLATLPSDDFLALRDLLRGYEDMLALLRLRSGK